VLGPIQFISYREKVITVFHRHKVRYYLYADDKQSYTDIPVEDITLARSVLHDCTRYCELVFVAKTLARCQ